MKILAKIIMVLTAFSMPLFASSEDLSSTKDKKILYLLELAQIDRTVQIGKESCSEAALSSWYSPGESVKKDGSYSGLTPTSAVWPSVLEAFQRYVHATCSAVTEQEVREMYVEFYRSKFSEDDLDEIISFMGSAVGRRLFSNQNEFTRAFSDTMNRRSLAAADEAAEALRKEVSALNQQERRNNPAGFFEWLKFIFLRILSWGSI
ncbi:hypothetical protein BH11PSE11_BH11PSE11_28150 [soil metagenome]